MVGRGFGWVRVWVFVGWCGIEFSDFRVFWVVRFVGCFLPVFLDFGAVCWVDSGLGFCSVGLVVRFA